MKENTNTVSDMLDEKYIERCMRAGAKEPNASIVRSAWKAIGFYLPQKPMNLVTTWRR